MSKPPNTHPRVLLRCPDCDLLQYEPVVEHGEVARCPRCDARLRKGRRDTIDRTLALTTAALVLLAISNLNPFMTFEFKGRAQTNDILSGIWQLKDHGYFALAALIFFASIGAPLLYLGGMLSVLLPLRFDRCPRYAAPVFRAMLKLRPWSMLEVYLLGVIVAVVKLAELAKIVPGIAAYAFVALILLSSWSYDSLDEHEVWRLVGFRNER